MLVVFKFLKQKDTQELRYESKFECENHKMKLEYKMVNAIQFISQQYDVYKFIRILSYDIYTHVYIGHHQFSF